MTASLRNRNAPFLVLLVLFAIGPQLAELRWIVEVVLALLIVIFSWSCLADGDAAETTFGRKDPSAVVADEVAGMALTMLALPWRPMPEGLLYNIGVAATAFFAFRIFDIVKPPPANGLQRLGGGLGILIDDLIAGVYALLLTQGLVRWVWPMV